MSYIGEITHVSIALDMAIKYSENKEYTMNNR